MLSRTTLSLLAVGAAAGALLTACGPKTNHSAETPAPAAAPMTAETATPPGPGDDGAMTASTTATSADTSATTAQDDAAATGAARRAASADRAATPASATERYRDDQASREWSSNGSSRDTMTSAGTGRTGFSTDAPSPGPTPPNERLRNTTVRQSIGAGGLGNSGFGGTPGSDRRQAEANAPR